MRSRSTDVIIIGAGHAGLSMSRCLYGLNIPHYVLERGRVAERWRSESWDSLHLLTPNSFATLPGKSYQGPHPEGFMPVSEWITFLEEYANSFQAPVHIGVNVEQVTREGDLLLVRSGDTEWGTRSVVIASGYCSEPYIPSCAKELPAYILQLSSSTYRRPGQLPDGGVMVVGSGASGVQIAEELVCAGREVTLSVGAHRRLPRVYRDHDILWWSDRIGVFNQRTSPALSGNIPAPQLIGSDTKRSVDLGILQELGVRLTGSLAHARGACLSFRSDLETNISNADTDMYSFLEKVDQYACQHRMNGTIVVPPPVHPRHYPSCIDLHTEKINTIIWATGYRRSYPWLQLDILDHKGEILQHEGITPEPGVYVIGMRRQIRYNSNFINGAGEDALEISGHIANYLKGK